MDILIYVLVGVIALAVIIESMKRSKGASQSSTPAAQNSEDSEPYISADEADPTQTGRMRAMPIKKAIQGAGDETPQKAATQLKKPNVPKSGGANSNINHEKVESTETGGFELPDPFSVDLSEDQKE